MTVILRCNETKAATDVVRAWRPRRRLILAGAALLGLVSWLPGCGDDDGGQNSAPDSGTLCGNGVVDDGEECDDGNQDNSDGCCTTCLFCDNCTVEAGRSCSPGETVCCRTSEDLPTECAARSGDASTAYCLQGCDAAADCHRSNECSTDFDDHCYPVTCGAAYATELNTPCAVAGETGYCYPQGAAEDLWGVCVEPGTLPAGAACDAGYALTETPRSVETCQNGVCTTFAADRAPSCLPFCDPEAAYDASTLGAAACPNGYNCLNLSYISTYSNVRLADKGLCVPTPSTDASGLLSCDQQNGELIASRALTCNDLLPGTYCGTYRNGSLMGICKPLDATPLGHGDPCTSQAETPCEQGTLCYNSDPFGDGTNTQSACLEICDAAANPTCTTAGLICTSLSYATQDASPTRFGLCAPPPPPGQ